MFSFRDYNVKKGKLLHPEVAKIIASIGHKQFITLADAGLPIPENLARVDLAITQGVPSFMTVLETVTSEMQVEKIILAEEIKLVEPLYQKILNYLADLSKLKKIYRYRLY